MQGPPSPNLPNLDNLRQIRPLPPKAPAPVAATKCRRRDKICKKLKGEVSSNLLPTSNARFDHLLARADKSSGYTSAKLKGDDQFNFGFHDLDNLIWNRNRSISKSFYELSPLTSELSDFKDRADDAFSAAALTPILESALLDPNNRTGNPGEDLLSRNYNWNLPLMELAGRAGLDFNLTLSLNSLIWVKNGSEIHFDPDWGFPAPGFRLGFPTIQRSFYNSDAGCWSFLMLTPSGRRVEFRQTGANIYETADSSYLYLTYNPSNGTHTVLTTDGSQLKFQIVIDESKLIEAKDRNGNYITITYTNFGEINNITDTLGRVITFNYDTYNHINSITQTWGGQTHTWATFAYGTQVIQTNFPGLSLFNMSNGYAESVLTRVGLADGSIYSFEYNTYGQVKTIRRYLPNIANPQSFPGDYFQRAYITYNLPSDGSSPQTDCPRFTTRTDWAHEWNPGAVTTTYGPATPNYSTGEATYPDGTLYKEFYATTGWQKGLTTQTETWSGGVKKKWTATQWTQDNTGLSYRLNPRVIESNVYDDSGNQRRTTIEYTSYGLPRDVYEYDAAPNTSRVLRRTHTDYNLNSVYTSRRIIGLPSAQFVYDGNGYIYSGGTYNNPGEILAAKITYDYDLGGEFQVHQGPPIRHDTTNYGSGFVQGRENLNTVRRWDVTDSGNLSKSTTFSTGFNTSGSAIFKRDALNHQTNISYTDSFSDLVNRNTLAYPTTATDPDSYSSAIQYNFDFGAVTRAQDPKGAVVTTTYDSVGRVDRITNQVTGAYTRYVYPHYLYHVLSYTTVNDATELYSLTFWDGHDRLRATASDNPTSVGQYKAQFNSYDSMGRLWWQSRQTEIFSDWNCAGDDQAAGWGPTLWTIQTYDWKGRPTVTTNRDGTTKEISYGGCGCAGGEVVTIKDEGTVVAGQTKRREQKIFHDILGRTIKTKIMTWESGPVSLTTVNTYNVRDQITSVKEYSGDAAGTEACPSSTCQITNLTHDGHGRLWKQRRPVETADNVYLYNNDDTLWKATDPRGVNSIYAYNNRGLVTGITYDALSNAVLQSPLPSLPIPSANVTFGYDEAGNRTWMDDAPGRVDYTYDQLSRLKEETRLFDVGGVTRSFTLKYDYNLIGQLKQLTDPWNAVITYNRNKAGQETSVTGSGYKDLNQWTNRNVNNFANDIKYRAWDGIKQFTNGSLSGNTSFAMGYNVNMQLSSFTGGGRTTEHDYYNDGLVKEARDLYYGANFLRKYEYDFAGQLTTASAGGTAPSSSSPYSLTYGYDAWGRTNSRQGSHWSQTLANFSTTYTNDRDVNMNYDAAGNLKGYSSSPDPNIHDDAASQQFTQVVESGAPQISRIRENYYDGDGAKIFYKTSDGSLVNGLYSQFSNDYLIRSTVLGGKVIAEYKDLTTLPINDPNKYSSRSYVYLKGVQLAYQNQAHSTTAKSVVWTYHNPTVGNYFAESQLNDSNYQQINVPFGEMTFDPLGSYVGLSEQQPINISIPFSFSIGQFIDNFAGKCYADGIETSCALVQSALTNGIGVQVSWGTTSVGKDRYSTGNPAYNLVIDWDNGVYGFVPAGGGFGEAGARTSRPTLKPKGQANPGIDDDKQIPLSGFPSFNFASQRQQSSKQRQPQEPPVTSDCPNTWNKVLLIFKGLAKRAIGTNFQEFNETLSSQKWRIAPKEGFSEKDTINAFRNAGWKPFFNGNPGHFGGSDYEKYYKGAWYHVTIGYGERSTINYDEIITTNDSNQPPPWITIHCEERFRPSSYEHFRDYMLRNWKIDIDYINPPIGIPIL